MPAILPASVPPSHKSWRFLIKLPKLNNKLLKYNTSETGNNNFNFVSVYRRLLRKAFISTLFQRWLIQHMLDAFLALSFICSCVVVLASRSCVVVVV